MEIKQQLIITAGIVYLGLISVKSQDQRTYQVGKIQKNFQNLFNTIAKNNAGNNEIHSEILNQEVIRERQTFDTIKEELQIARDRNAYKKRNFYHSRNNAYKNVIANKRETNENNPSSNQATKSSSVDEITHLRERMQNQTNVLQRILNLIPDVRDVMVPAKPPMEDTLLYQYVKEINEIEAAIGKLNQTTESSSANEMTYLRERTQNQTNVLRRMLKIIPDVRDVMVPAKPPMEDTLLYQYVKEINEIEEAISKLLA